MARKKQEIALQVVLETQEEWEEMLAKEGLTVVDIFQEWAGPCTGMVSSFRRLKNELGDDSLHFAVAKSDTIDSLEKYRGKCEPCFLFFAGGVLVSQMRGANAPQLMRMITEQLAYEHKVLEGNAERKEIKDPMLIGAESPKDEEEEEEDEGMEHMGERIIFENLPEYADDQEEQKKGFTLAIIKPNVVADGKVEEILEKIREAGIEILEHKEKLLTEEEAREFYAHKKDEEYFEDLIKFMTSGPSHVLVITKGQTGEGIIEEWRELLGPASVEEARQLKPDSLRAQYGGDKSYVNALHGSDSHETAMRELAFFFPDFVVPTIPGGKSRPKLQRTLALIRPDALRERKDEILAKIKEAGFTVAMQKEVQLSREQAEEFYKEHKNEAYFEELVNRMTNGPLLALALAREDAVTGWKEMLGPKEVEEAKAKAPESLRAQFSVDDVPINQIHGSDTEEHAQKELGYFFPMQQTVAVVKPDAYETKDEIMNKIREAGFHIAARKETELTRDIAEQFYRDQKDKEYFSDLTEHMTSGPTLFMVLSREDAVEGWRSLMGPTDPEKAKDENPETLRAQFGSDIKANAIHGSSTEEHAQESMKLIFGELKFKPDGTVVKPDKETKASKKQKQADSQEEKTEAKGKKEPEKDEDQKKGETKEETEEEKKDEEDKKSVKEEAKQDKDETEDTKSHKSITADDEKTGDEKHDSAGDEHDIKDDDKKTSDKEGHNEKKDDTKSDDDKVGASETDKGGDKDDTAGEKGEGKDDVKTDSKTNVKTDEQLNNSEQNLEAKTDGEEVAVQEQGEKSGTDGDETASQSQQQLDDSAKDDEAKGEKKEEQESEAKKEETDKKPDSRDGKEEKDNKGNASSSHEKDDKGDKAKPGDDSEKSVKEDEKTKADGSANENNEKDEKAKTDHGADSKEDEGYKKSPEKEDKPEPASDDAKTGDTVKEEDKKTDSEKEDDKKADTQKEDDKKADTQKEDDKKADTEKEDDKKADTEKEDDKEADTEKEDDKNAGTQKEDDKNADTQKEDDKNADTQKEDDKKADTEKEDDKKDDAEKPTQSSQDEKKEE